ncbi:MAG: hypothetical protein ACPIB2_04350 [Flavobacteriaceae bacterium]
MTISSLVYRPLKLFTGVGLLFGFALGYLYGVGGFFYDWLTTGVNKGTLLALNALWGMPLIFGALGTIIGGLLGLLHYALKKLSIARR